jgi:hypothetical protein
MDLKVFAGNGLANGRDSVCRRDQIDIDTADDYDRFLWHIHEASLNESSDGF